MGKSLFLTSQLLTLMLSSSSIQAMKDTDSIPDLPFIFVRHGHTPWGVEAITLGPQDLALDETGREQARKAAQYLTKDSNKPLTLVSSPLIRAKETAQEVVNSYRAELPIHVIVGLQERYYGDYRTVTADQIPSDAENEETFNERVKTTFAGVLSEFWDKSHTLIVVSHEKVFEALTNALTGTPLRLNQGGIAIFTHQATGWQIEMPRVQKR